MKKIDFTFYKNIILKVSIKLVVFFKMVGHSQDQCSICFDELKNRVLVESNCGHIFHEECVEELIENSKRSYFSEDIENVSSNEYGIRTIIPAIHSLDEIKCPICRGKFNPYKKLVSIKMKEPETDISPEQVESMEVSNIFAKSSYQEKFNPITSNNMVRRETSFSPINSPFNKIYLFQEDITVENIEKILLLNKKWRKFFETLLDNIIELLKDNFILDMNAIYKKTINSLLIEDQNEDKIEIINKNLNIFILILNASYLYYNSDKNLSFIAKKFIKIIDKKDEIVKNYFDRHLFLEDILNSVYIFINDERFLFVYPNFFRKKELFELQNIYDKVYIQNIFTKRQNIFEYWLSNIPKNHSLQVVSSFFQEYISVNNININKKNHLTNDFYCQYNDMFLKIKNIFLA